MGRVPSVQEGSRKAIIAAFFANLGIAIAKFAGFIITGSAGLLAEAGHSLADTGNQGLLMYGGKAGKRPADRAHPFGYGPERYFWSFVVALVLFSMGGLFALYEGYHKFKDPHEIESAGVAYAILGFAIVLESFSLRTAVKEANHVRGNRGWWEFVRTAKSPELPVVLLEDVGAEIGLFMALAGLSIAEFTGDARWDALGSIGIGILLVVIAIILAAEMKGLLLGEAATDEHLTAIEESIAGAPHVKGVIHLRTMHLGPDRLLVGAKVEYDHDLGLPELADAIDATELRIREAVHLDSTIYIEPDVRRKDPTG